MLLPSAISRGWTARPGCITITVVSKRQTRNTYTPLRRLSNVWRRDSVQPAGGSESQDEGSFMKRITDVHVHIQPWRDLKPQVQEAMRRGKEAHWDLLIAVMDDPKALLEVLMRLFPAAH